MFDFILNSSFYLEAVPMIPGRHLVGTSEEERLMGVDEDPTDNWREKNRYQTLMG